METTNDNLIDKQLYISMQQGNKKAFDTLFIKYYAMLCAFARSFVSLEDAEEVVQDTMLQIWENRKTNHTSNPQLSSSASFLRLNVLSSLN